MTNYSWSWKLISRSKNRQKYTYQIILSTKAELLIINDMSAFKVDSTRKKNELQRVLFRNFYYFALKIFCQKMYHHKHKAGAFAV